jgi:hypothetical protein
MSKKSNVHPDHYKTAGRVPQGQNVVHAIEREALRQQHAQEERTAVKSKGAEKGKMRLNRSLP